MQVFGKKVSTPMAVAIGGGSLLAIWFAVKQHSASSAGSSSGSAVDPVTGLPASQDNQTDPQTGMTYLGEAQQYGSVAAAEQALAGSYAGGATSAYGTYGGGGYNGAGQSTVPANVVQGTTYGSNAAWAQAAEAGLTDIGYSPTDVAAALGRYLGNLPETGAQAGIVQAAVAEYGPPPVGSFQVILQPTTGGTGSGGGKVKLPNVVGLDVAQASQVLTSSGFKVHGPAAVKGVTHIVTGQEPKAGSQEAMGTVVTLQYRSTGHPSQPPVPRFPPGGGSR